MKHYFKTPALATVTLALPLVAYSQTSTDQDSRSIRGAGAPISGHLEALRMVRARTELMRSLDARKDQSGSAVQAKLRQNVTLIDGTELPNGTILVGEVTVDDMHQEGMSTLALRFDQARLKNGTIVRIKATIVGFYDASVEYSPDASAPEPGDQVPNSWTDGTLQVDQINVVGGVNLHSKISSVNSGVFVSAKKDDIKLQKGSEIQFAIGPGQGR